MSDPLTRFGTKVTHQRNAVPGRHDQVKNHAGGYVFQIDPISQLTRFLTIGTASNAYYAGKNENVEENGRLIISLTETPELHKAVVDKIVEISLAGRAPKQNPTLFALAIACQMGELEGRKYAWSKITQVVRTGTHMFIFIGYLEQFGGWTRSLRKAVGNWYTELQADDLALQLVKYRQRAGWTHRDVLRKTHPKIEGPRKRAAIGWTMTGKIEEPADIPPVIWAHERTKDEGASIPSILKNAYLPWEALPDSAMNDPKVWEQLLDNGMPTGALIRQLPRLTNMGLLPQMGPGRTDDVIGQLLDPRKLAKARIHPINALVAMKVYASGRSVKGDTTWTPTPKIIDALNDMFYASFGYIEPTGKRYLLGVDVSGSMWGRPASDDFPLNAAEVAGVMALVTASIEPNHHLVGFSAKRETGFYNQLHASNMELRTLPISKRQRLDDVMRTMEAMPMGGTDISLPMLEAIENKWEVDTFVMYTDGETHSGRMHPFQALKQYRKASGIDAKLVVVAVTATGWSVADPKDPGMLDISGFDSAAPQLISDFSAGLM